MPLTMKEKQAVTKQLALEYKRAGKKAMGKILDTVIQLTRYNRSYAARVLREWAKPKVLSQRTKRARLRSPWSRMSGRRGRSDRGREKGSTTGMSFSLCERYG